MANYATLKLEFSTDPLSDTTPAWTDITRFCKSADWSQGKARDLDDPPAGGATFLLKNDLRRFEPEYAAGAFYPNIVPLRRFRLTITTATGSVQQGIFYATSWNVTYPARTAYSEVEVSCVDGFGVLSLALLPTLDPAEAVTLADVQAFDQPFAQYLLDDPNSTKMTAAAGPEGVYLNKPLRSQAPIAVGDNGTSVLFAANQDTGRANLDATNQFSDGNAFTIECVASASSGSQRLLVGGPYSSVASEHSFAIYANSMNIALAPGHNGGGFIAPLGITPSFPGPHHYAFTFDGTTAITYIDGVQVGSINLSGWDLRSGDDGGHLYVGGSAAFAGFSAWSAQISHAAFYERALTGDRIAAHAAAALTRGYATQLAGDRIAAIATNPLWNVASVASGTFPVQPRMQTGQSRLDEIVATVKAEEPWAQFYFNGAGNPVYLGWDSWDGRVDAVLGDTAGEVPYTDVTLVYDDELFNEVIVSREGGTTQISDDTTSQAAYGLRAFSESGLLMAEDDDALNVANEILSRFGNPSFRVESVTLNGANPLSLAQITTRVIGDIYRVRRRGVGNTPIDVITMILGRQLSFDPDGNLSCTYSLARGFNAADGYWHLGVTGYSELGNTTVLA